MKVKELIEALSKFDQEDDVFVFDGSEQTTNLVDKVEYDKDGLPCLITNAYIL